ncbi:MAG TPA: S26 family signal peptidase, partial [Pirellulales bacterium]
VDRRAFQFRAPRRYEVASLHEPNRASQLCLKRVVGLPGERVAVRDGDVYINSQISRKGLAEQQAVALLVFDNAYRPDAASPAQARWQPDDGASRWRAAGSEFSSAADSDAASPARAAMRLAADDWLSYRHLVRVGDREEFVESPVLDTQGYNQTRPIVDPHAVSDLALSLEVEAERPGMVYLRARGGLGDFVCAIDVTTGACELRSEDQTLESRSGAALADGRMHALYFSLIDRQVLLAIDGRVVIEHALDEQSSDADASVLSVSGATRPFAIASDCPALRIASLKVVRDVYYTPVGGATNSPSANAETELAEDEFYVLSDNSRLGFDSRYAGFGPAAPFNLFVGKPLTAYSRSPRSPGWRGGIQVPAVWRIRYIR